MNLLRSNNKIENKGKSRWWQQQQELMRCELRVPITVLAATCSLYDSNRAHTRQKHVLLAKNENDTRFLNKDQTSIQPKKIFAANKTQRAIWWILILYEILMRTQMAQKHGVCTCELKCTLLYLMISSFTSSLVTWNQMFAVNTMNALCEYDHKQTNLMSEKKARLTL